MKKRPKKLLNPDSVVLLKQIGIGLLVFCAVALTVTAIWHGSRVQSLTISEITVEGGETIDHGQVVAVVEGELVGEYWRLIPKRFNWFYPQNAIVERLEEIDRIYNIVVDTANRTTIHVTFDEYVPFALWCTDRDTDDCLFLDRRGYAFASAPRLFGGSFLRFYTDTEPTLEEFVLAEATWENALELEQLLSERGWFVSALEFDVVGDGYISLVPSGELKINFDYTPKQLVDNLFTVLNNDPFTDLTAGSFQYIDLRYGNKVFVKEEDVAEEVATTTESEVE